MRKTFFTLALIMIYMTYQAEAQDGSEPFVTVSGRGEVKVLPDKASVNIAVELRNKEADELRKEIDKTASDIIALLKKQKVEDKDIQTSYITISPHFPENTRSRQTSADYYSGQKAMTFVLRNLSNYDTIMSRLYELGINRVDGVSFGIEDRETPQVEAKGKAAANAKKKATAMLTALGAKLGNIYSIKENSYNEPFENNVEVQMAAVEDSVDSSSPSSGPSISSGELTFTADIEVIFYIIQ